jgi:signal transduction histidine kinase
VNPLIHNHSKRQLLQRLTLGLVLLSLLALYANEHWMKRYLTIDLHSSSNVSVIDDRRQGGKSIARLSKATNNMRLDCDIIPGYQWPFCELAIELGNDVTGINLNQFDSLRLKLHSEGPEKDNPVRVFLRNFNPAYSVADSAATLKPHEIVYDPQKNAAAVEFQLSQFMVASWWTQENPTSIEHLGPQLDRVLAISFTTGGNVTPGKHSITVDSAEFVGLWISTENFRLGLIFFWLAIILTYLAWEWRESKQELRESDRLKKALEKSNEELESKVEERTRALAASNSRLIDTLQNLEGTRYELVENEKNAALGALVSGVAHELNTPIGNALLVSSTLSDKVKELETISESQLTRKALRDFFADANQGTAMLLENLERAATLISSFKQLSADQHSEQRRQFRLFDVVEETQLAMNPRIRQTSHVLAIDIPPELIMDAYPGPLSQIFINFINNSLLHAFENIPQGHMLLSARAFDNDMVEIKFSDDGNGIPAAVLRRVFEPFFTTKLGEGGSGLGMHLAHTVVTQIFGGKIDIESLPGEGTSICLLLPLIAPKDNPYVFKLGVPKDVLEDYQSFLGDRKLEQVSDFSGEHSRRDVVELAFFIRAFNTTLTSRPYELVAVDSYANGLEQLRASSIAALATTCWQSDLLAYAEEISMSDAMIADGQSVVGIYTDPRNQIALRCKSLDDFRQLRLVSNRDWSADWNTLTELGISHCVDVKTWRQMLYMVSSGEVDALLAPFATHHEMAIELDDCQLVPVPGLRIALHGSRHFACGKCAHSNLLAEAIFPELKRYIDDGSFAKALSECGFINTETADWIVLNP